MIITYWLVAGKVVIYPADRICGIRLMRYRSGTWKVALDQISLICCKMSWYEMNNIIICYVTTYSKLHLINWDEKMTSSALKQLTAEFLSWCKHVKVSGQKYWFCVNIEEKRLGLYVFLELKFRRHKSFFWDYVKKCHLKM